MSTLWLSNAFRPGAQYVQDEQTQQQLYNNGLPDRIICYSEAQLLIGDLEFHVCVEVEIDRFALRQQDNEVPVVSEVGRAEHKGRTAENGVG